MTGVVIAVTAGALIVVAQGALWLADRGTHDGDHPADAYSSITADAGGALLVMVTNPSATSVVAGCRLRPRLTPDLLQGVVPALVVRAASRAERRRVDRGASEVLGVVEARSTRTWRLPTCAGPIRCLVILGQPGGRLRVHDHALPATSGCR
jgi:hypothetical protein